MVPATAAAPLTACLITVDPISLLIILSAVHFCRRQDLAARIPLLLIPLADHEIWSLETLWSVGAHGWAGGDRRERAGRARPEDGIMRPSAWFSLLCPTQTFHLHWTLPLPVLVKVFQYSRVEPRRALRTSGQVAGRRASGGTSSRSRLPPPGRVHVLLADFGAWSVSWMEPFLGSLHDVWCVPVPRHPKAVGWPPWDGPQP